jgi:sugar (pentulose or hexulose) kinase
LKNQSILAIDCGTQSLRASLFSGTGQMIACVKKEYAPYFSHKPGWAEQDPELYWQSLIQACKLLKEEAPQAFDNVAGVGVASQRASMINVDENGLPLRPCIVWLDRRQAKPVFGQKGFLNLLLKYIGLPKSINNIQAQGKCNWIMQNQPEIWKKTAKYLQVAGFLYYRLTGEFHDSVASQIGYLPFDYKKQKWADHFQLSRKLFPVEKDKLPKLFRPGETLGAITTKAFHECGIKKGTPVISCGADKGCETLGAGVIHADQVSLSLGTDATIQTVFDRYIELVRFMPAYPAVIPGRYNPEIEIHRGFWMISWFKKQFALKEIEEAAKLGVPVEEILNQCLKRTSPGAMGLVMQPYWGYVTGKDDVKGLMIGFGDVHTKDHIYRALIEGLGFGLYEGLGKIEKKTGIKVKNASLSGGASQSDEICQIMANIFNRPMIKGQTHETSSLGAAILVAKGLNWYKSIEEAAENMVHVKRVFKPDSDAVEIYQALYAEVYLKLYKILKPLYARIRKITGYPK